MTWRLLITAASVALATSASAQPVPDDRCSVEDQICWENVLFEAAFALAIPSVWYLGTEEHQQVDFSLGLGWDGWKTKLTSTDKLKWDTNPFHINAIRHPLAGTVDYQIARSNGAGPVISTLLTALKSALWEYVIESREAPSLNDMILNPSAGLSIGEPMYQLGQLWRGGAPTWADRARTAVFSPFDAVHDTDRPWIRRARPRPWRSIELAAGAMQRRTDGEERGELALAADLDLVAEPAYGARKAQIVSPRSGAWSRFRVGARLGDAGRGNELVSTELRTSTSWFGRYQHDGAGIGTFLGIGSAFTYQNDSLAIDKDRLAIAHLIGPQLSLRIRGRDVDLRLDAAAYADFGLVEALVFSPENPFPRPPPFYSSLQADGYIDAFGVTGATRLRVITGAMRADLEVTTHGLWQAVGHDRDAEGNGEQDDTDAGADAPMDPAVTTFGVAELRACWRGQLGYVEGPWEVALVVDGARRHSKWARGGKERTVSDHAIGAVVTLTY